MAALKEPLLTLALATSQRDALTRLLKPTLTGEKGRFVASQMAEFGQLLDTLARRKTGWRELQGAADDDLTQLLRSAPGLFDAARLLASDSRQTWEQRIIAAGLLARDESQRGEALPILAAMLQPQTPGEAQRAAIKALGISGDASVPGLLIKAWPSIGPETRLTLLDDQHQVVWEQVAREAPRPKKVFALTDPVEVKRIARMFRDNRYNIKVALRALLTSDAFYAPQNRAALIKSPVDLVVGTVRQFHIQAGDVLPFVLATRQLGQDLFAPPNVKGWPGGDAWINSATLLQRKQLLDRLFQTQQAPRMTTQRVNDMQAASGNGKFAGIDGRARFARALQDIHVDADKWQAQFRGNEHLMVKTLIAGEPANPPPAQVNGAGRIRELVLDPAYQLK